VLQAEDELAAPVQASGRAHEGEFAHILEFAMVDLAVKEMDLVARLLGVDDPVVSPVLLFGPPSAGGRR
jgi:hypothetical protein